MEWHKLIGFYETAKCGSLTKASKTIFRTQSAVSQQIKALENELNCSLFERIGKKTIRLTLAGERLYSFVDTILRQRLDLLDDIDAINTRKKGRLRIGGQFAFFYYTLPEIVKNYIRKYPMIDVMMSECPLYDGIPLVRSGDIDFGIFTATIVPDDLLAIKWKKADLVLITPLDHPLTKEKEITLEKIARFPLIFSSKRPPHKGNSVFESNFIKEKIKYRVTMETSTIELGSKYVEMGLGISVAPAGFGLDSLKKRNLAFIPINHLFNEEYISVVMRKDKVLQPHKQAFIDMLFEPRPGRDG